MDVRKEMPNEVKNEIVDGKKKVVTVLLPEKQKTVIEAKREERNKLAQRFYQISINVTKGQRMLNEISIRMEEIDTLIGDRIKEGFKKLKLDKQKERQWRFDGRDSFIGIYNPPPKKKEEGGK